MVCSFIGRRATVKEENYPNGTKAQPYREQGKHDYNLAKGKGWQERVKQRNQAES